MLAASGSFALIFVLGQYACLAAAALIVAGDAYGAGRNGTEASQPALQGIWERSGYGDIYHVKKKRVTVFQYTRETCFQSEKLEVAKFRKSLADIVINEVGSGFTATAIDAPAFRRHYARLDSLPDVCGAGNILSGFSPSGMFEHVWHTFNDYYAFFERRNVDWVSQYALLRGRLEDDMSGRALYVIMKQLFTPINDGHVYLESSSSEFNPAAPRGAQIVLEEGYQRQSRFRRYREYANSEMTRYENILWSYVDNDSRRRSGGVSGDLLAWGTIEQSVGYLLVKSMGSISSKHRSSSADDVVAVHQVMDRVMSDLSDTVGMIVDVRFNGGGADAVGLAIAGRFTDSRRLAVSKAPRTYRGEGQRLEAYVVPGDGVPYLKPVVIIAGPDSASATEIFLMAMRALPQVTQLGESTNGILSDELVKKLPKGWRFTLSNEVYYDHTGANHEVTGIVPHIHAPVFSLGDLEGGRNSALEAALAILTNSP